MFEAMKKRKEEKERQRREERARQHKEEIDRQREEGKERQRRAAENEAMQKRKEEFDRKRREERAHQNDPTVVIKRAANRTFRLVGDLAGFAWKNTTADNGKAALNKAVETAAALPSGVKSVYNYVDRSLKLRETFACYTNSGGRIYPGTLYFTGDHIIFATEHLLPAYIITKKRDLPLLPPGEESWNKFYDYEISCPSKENRIYIAWRDVRTIKQRNSGSSSERSIEIDSQMIEDFKFMGFIDYEKAFYTLNLLRPSV